jgi:hypothetical protein
MAYSSSPSLNPKRPGEGRNLPIGQEMACHFSQDHTMTTKILDFIHNDPNYSHHSIIRPVRWAESAVQN